MGNSLEIAKQVGELAVAHCSGEMSTLPGNLMCTNTLYYDIAGVCPEDFTQRVYPETMAA